MGVEDVASIANLVQNVGITLVVAITLAAVTKYLFNLYVKSVDARLEDVRDAMSSQLKTTGQALEASERQREALQQMVFEKMNAALTGVSVDREAIEKVIQAVEGWKKENAVLHKKTLDAIHDILPDVVQKLVSESIVQEVKGVFKEVKE